MLVLHGYQRPGDGAIIGRCMGVGWQPVEHSPEGIVAALKHLRRGFDDAGEAKRKEGDVTSRALATRIRFAEAELARWCRRGIHGIDLPALGAAMELPLPRMPLTPEEMEARLERGLGFTESLEAVRRREDVELRALSPPIIKLVATVLMPADPELDALARAVRASNAASLRARGNEGPRRNEAAAMLRERERDRSIATDRLRIAVAATVKTWLAAVGVQDVVKPSSETTRGNIRIRTRFEPRSHDEADAVVRSMTAAGAPEWQATSRGAPMITWRIAATSLSELAAMLGVQSADPGRQKSSLKRLRADIPTRDDLIGWDGRDVRKIASLLQWFNEQPANVPDLWRMPATLDPFATWHRDRLESRVGKAVAARWPADAACDELGNVVFLDTRGRWQVIPFIDLCDHDQCPIDMPDSDLGVLEEAGVMAVDENRRALILEIEGADSGIDRFTGFRVVDVDRILGY